MKLFIDENISYRILPLIEDNFPNTKHVTAIKKRMSDLQIWNYAKKNGYIIVTYDEDFYEWQQLKGYPPKVVWLRIGNAPTKVIAEALNSSKDNIKAMISEDEIGILEIH